MEKYGFKGTSKKHTHVLYIKKDKSNIIKTYISKSLWSLKNKLDDGKLYEQEDNQNKYYNDYNKKEYVEESDIGDNDYIIQGLMTLWPIQDMIAYTAIELLLRYYDDIKKMIKDGFFHH